MNAGIIAAFKRHYRRLHLHNALDRDDAGAADLYKVNQVTAMRWSLMAWSEISSTTIANCFKHTGLMNEPTSPAVEGGASAGDIQQPVQQDADLVDQEKQEVEKDLESALQRLPLSNHMSIASLLNPVDEEPTVHAKLSDAEIIKLVQDAKKGEEGEAEEELVTHSIAEKLAALALSISLLELSQDQDRAAHRALRRIQAQLRSANTIQTTLDSWLK
uniref:DDE-1 domain-containing protein n=1 Tax=Peronospora matthiolae TaxID=2874970 RepID=A0AAV1UMG8_9STRA